MAAVFDRRRRPDPQQGVFETLLVIDGRPVEPDAHLARLRASLAELFPDHESPPLDVPSLMHPYAPLSEGTSAGDGRGALRIAVSPDGEGGLRSRTEMREAHLGGEISLHSVPLAGGLGAHKWTDRSLLDETQATLPEGALSLLIDEDGSVLEASRANVFAVRDGVLLTPPLDGRILPGVTRTRVMELAREIGIDIHETDLSQRDLLAADEVFLTGSVRGIERVDAVDGTPLRNRGEIAGHLITELWRSWAGAKTAPLR